MILDDILENKVIELNALKTEYSHLINDLSPSVYSLEEKLLDNTMSYIFEFKQSSPSKGKIRDDLSIHDVTNIYKKYASAISVLTDKKYFNGDYRFIKDIRNSISLPILCKDFMIDSFQITLARFMGADAILLMLSVLSDEKYQELSECAHSLNMDIITEVHSEEEVKRALNHKAKIIGINNRDFKDLSVDPEYCKCLLPLIPKDQLVISESGFQDYHQIKAYEGEINGVLIGSSVMASDSIEKKIHELLYNRIKICGIKNQEQTNQLQNFPLSYIGYIFAPLSKRKIDSDNYFPINSEIKTVAVFQNQAIDEIQSILNKMDTDIIQLHGNEDNSFINQLSALFPNKEIWKSNNSDYEFVESKAKRQLFDSGNGGTGKRFDWSIVNKSKRKDAILAGGLSEKNISEAMIHNFFAYDINSGVEISPGEKSIEKINKLFEQIRIKSK